MQLFEGYNFASGISYRFREPDTIKGSEDPLGEVLEASGACRDLRIHLGRN